MTIKETARERFINEVVRAVQPASGFKVLVVDRHAMRILSASCRMFDIVDEGVTLVESLELKRKPLVKFDAIYFITPTEKSINHLIEDFDNASRPQYGAVHLFLTSACPDSLFSKISGSNVARFLKTFQEVNIDFLAVESQVYSLDCPQVFHHVYSPVSRAFPDAQRRIAEQIATLCATLQEYPLIRFSDNNDRNRSLAILVQDRIDEYRKNLAYPVGTESNAQRFSSSTAAWTLSRPFFTS
eukprot:Opistho-2@2974